MLDSAPTADPQPLRRDSQGRVERPAPGRVTERRTLPASPPGAPAFGGTTPGAPSDPGYLVWRSLSHALRISGEKVSLSNSLICFLGSVSAGRANSLDRSSIVRP